MKIIRYFHFNNIVVKKFYFDMLEFAVQINTL